MSTAGPQGGTQAGVRTFENPEALARSAAQWLVTAVRERGGTCAVCLSGGSTPRRLYEVLAVPPLVGRMPWEDVHWFWGDERFVPPDHPDSNFRMADEALLSTAPVPRDHVHPVPTVGLSLADAARQYEATLKRFYGDERLDPVRPLFDVMLLGLGEDGHTASLFPGNAALDERQRWVVGVDRAPQRITLTFPVLGSSRNVAFLVSGARKRNILARVLAGDRALPAARVESLGKMVWFADRAAWAAS